jgi:hypothetical protein
MKPFARGDIALGLTAGILLCLLAWQVIAPSATTIEGKPTNAEPRAPSPAKAISVAPPPYQAYAEIEQRPLFLAGRRTPAPPPPPAAPPPVQNIERYSVIGIVAAPARATALVRGQTSETIHLRVGQVFEGWTVEAILPRGILFASGDQKLTLEFKTNKSQQGQSLARTPIGMPPK